MAGDGFASEIGRYIWDSKYRYRRGGEVEDRSVRDTWRRVARALAEAEPRDRAAWSRRFLSLLEGFRFLPGGRIQAGAGTSHRVTLFNCFVMGVIEDSLEGIFEALKEGAVTLQQGGGVGYDFSTLRPAGSSAARTGTVASGPVSFLRVWDAMCATVLSTGARRGAMMATLRADHPDVEAFLGAKSAAGELTRFNLSLLVPNTLMEAVEKGADWPLVFPADPGDPAGPTVLRRWPGRSGEVLCRVARTVPARELWQRVMRSTYERAEPGVLFVDRINRLNNLGYREEITATNPCGEVPLPPYGACDLGSVNLTRLVEEPFTERARFDWPSLAATVDVAVRLLDDVIEVSGFPLPAQRREARSSRRVGLGLTGLADTLVLLGLRYDSVEARSFAGRVMHTVCCTAYRASIELAREKGPFPYFDRDCLLGRPFIQGLPDDVRRGIAEVGLRNSHLTAIAPTGTISLLADGISSGLEPIYAGRYRRRVLQADGSLREIEIENAACRRFREAGRKGLPPAFVTGVEIAPEAHLEMQAALQPWVDQAISKTIHVPEGCPFEDFTNIYQRAFELGLKGCTTYRPNPVTGGVLADPEAEPGEGPHCCTAEREAD